MDKDMDFEKQVSKEYLLLRKKLLDYSYQDMNLLLENDQQIYIALFDIPIKSSIMGFQTQSIALVFGLNTHVYHGSGSFVIGLEKYPEVKEAMQSVLISSSQVLDKMPITDTTEFYNSDRIRVYLKTRNGIHFKELDENSNTDRFMQMLVNHILKEISKTKQFEPTP